MASIAGDNKAKRGRPRVDSERVVVRLPAAQLVHLDAWREAQPDRPGRPEAVRRLVAKALAGD